MAYEIYTDEPEPTLRDVMNLLSALKNGTIEMNQTIDERFEEMERKSDERFSVMDRKSDERFAEMDRNNDARFLAVSGNFTTVFGKAGSQFERTARTSVSNLFGQRYSSQLLCRCIFDITSAFSWEILQRDTSTSEGAMQYFLSRQIAERLLQDKIPQRLLMSIERKLSKVSTHHKGRI